MSTHLSIQVYYFRHILIIELSIQLRGSYYTYLVADKGAAPL
jgi:hypothetical protein